jgi:hypothetical protein
MSEMEGQMALFTPEGCEADVVARFDDEVCKECGECCTSSKDCVENCETDSEED